MIARSLGLGAAILLMLSAYCFICFLMAILTKETSMRARNLAAYFVFSLVPISLAYHVAHYFPFLFIGGQYAIPVISDPLGAGWDLFGTADYQVDITLISPLLQWTVAVAAVVIGHVVSLYIAHVFAMRLYDNARLALRGQFPMVIFMIGYTMLSLWILAQPIT